ncbi:unnamed protein product [Lathyrus sativus]|nr:unnamed protein product [Lathyrus sativus]
MNLTDLPAVGNKFTWFNSSGNCRSRLDRFLVDDTAISMLSLLNQLVGDRDVSDHMPVWLKSNFVNWGPKPFRSFNCWLSHKDFIPFVKKSWCSYHVSGSHCNILIKKFSVLKSDIRNWNRNVFGWLDLKIEKNVSNLNSLEMNIDLISSSNLAELNKDRLRAQEEMWKNLRIKESMLAQKSRLKWLQDGDHNSKFFHDSLRARYRSNCISAIRTGVGLEEEPDAIKSEAVKYFKERFKSNSSPKFTFDFDHIVCLAEEDRNCLEADFSLAEVRSAVFSCDGNKCPGTDGFNFSFIKSCWEILGEDFSNCILEFFNTGYLPKSFASSFISLVPKTKNTQHFEDFRPITLVSCVLKVISKMLASKLRKVIHKIISPSQTAFIPERQIYDGVLLANEVADFAKRSKMGCFFFKVDFAKAYDCVDWFYLDALLVKMGFGIKWMKWIRGSVFNSFVSILINGSSSKDFRTGRGLKQGDPLAPFLLEVTIVDILFGSRFC